MTTGYEKPPIAGPLKLIAGFLTRFKSALLILVGAIGAAFLIYSGDWDWAGPVIILSFIASLVLGELVSSLEGRISNLFEGWLKGLDVPLFILAATVLVYKVIGILTMPDSK